MNFDSTKFYIGPMSKNIVDTIVEANGHRPNSFGFIPSRRQIDFNSGYVNGWTTQVFSDYVNGKTIIQRDHGGPLQGEVEDYGFESFAEDAKNFDIIHIDPWKSAKSFAFGAYYTVDYIKYIYNINPNIYFEIGTEEAIQPLSIKEMETFLHLLKKSLDAHVFHNIKYLVVQSGVGLNLINRKNIGNTSFDKLKDMIKVANDFGVMTKEHNGDYLSLYQMKKRFDLGLSAINIAPEFGQIETECYLNAMSQRQLEKYYKICYNSNRWKKWVGESFDPLAQKRELIMVCGHYVLSDMDFIRIKPNIDDEIKKCINQKLIELIDLYTETDN